MAHHRLFPRPGHPFLTPADAISRMASAFRSVRTDPHRGAAHVRQMVRQLRRMSHLTPPPATEEEIARLAELERESLFVTIADDPDSNVAYLTTCVIPGEPLFFGYSSSEHERAASPILVRCAEALGYEIEHG